MDYGHIESGIDVSREAGWCAWRGLLRVSVEVPPGAFAAAIPAC
ncbi:hypothetical protein OKW38_006283 [Paraburkholderia sp. MM5496-R1]